MSGFVFGARSIRKLEEAHPDLQRVMRLALELTSVDFAVICGARTIAEQKKLVAQGASKTMRSRHIPGADGLSRAVDIAPIGPDGKISWAWPLYHKLAVAVKQAAAELNIPIEWGGDWRTFKDGPHWQLPWGKYP